MIIYGLDPSFRRTGLSKLNTDTKEINITSFPKTLPEKKGFGEMFDLSYDLTKEIASNIDEVGDIVSEIPPPLSSFSAGLYMLDSMLFKILIDRGFNITYKNPSTLAHVHGMRKYKKKASVDLCNVYLDEFKKDGYTVNIKGRFNHDMAESFIYLYLYYKEKIFK